MDRDFLDAVLRNEQKEEASEIKNESLVATRNEIKVVLSKIDGNGF